MFLFILLLLTGVHAFVASLHDGAVYARDEPRARHNAEQQPHDAVADPHHHVVEEEEVAEAVERFPAVEEQRLNGAAKVRSDIFICFSV